MSDNYQVTARKWRPMRFADVVGQDHVTRTLKNALRENRLAHAFLFTGQRGCGKTTVARILAKAINCPNAAANDYEPCNTCDICIGITEGRSMDVSEIDGASNNGVDDVRTMRENVKYPPLQGTHKVIIIDEVHMLSTSAFNALLKTLEEPPKYLVFIFATTEVQKLLPTILSRTQRYDFRRIQLDEIVGQLRTIATADNITIADDALLIIAKKADGSMRDGQSIFDQVVAYTGKSVEIDRVRDALNLIDLEFYFAVTEAIVSREPGRAFLLSSQVVAKGYDVEEFFIGLLDHFRNLLTVTITKSTSLVEVSKSDQERYVAAASDFSDGDLIRLVRLGQGALEKLKTGQQPRIVLEIALVEMMMMSRALELQELLGEIKSLKSLPVTTGRSSADDRSSTERSTPARKESVAPTSSRTDHSSTLARQPKLERTAVNPAIADDRSSGKFEGAVVNLDNDIISGRWVEFGEHIKQRSRALYSLFHDLEFCGFRRSMLYLGTSSTSTRDLILGHREEMQACLRDYFSAPLGFEVGTTEEMSAKAGSPIVKNPDVIREAIRPDERSSADHQPSADDRSSERTASASDGRSSESEYSDLERALMSEMGAHQI